MGLWQHEFSLVPRKGLLTELGHIPQQLEADLWDSIDWWQHCPFQDGIPDLFDRLLQETSFLSKETGLWGNINSDFLWIEYDDLAIARIDVRLDLREPFTPFMNRLLSLVQEFDWLFVSEDLQLLEPQAEKLQAYIAQTPAYKFVSQVQEHIPILHDRRYHDRKADEE